ncbi:hypothetical protein K3495_g338 [Podosphaera aphanis]|nr:hypothetical protein K3495_g338 [Podosphaera aphanis]
MSRSNDPDRFFQTDASEETRARRAAKSTNKYGNPLKLQSKILSVIPDPFSSDLIYIAESAGCIRKINIETREHHVVYRGPTAPVTSVAIGGAGGKTVFGGCWDKDIWSWDLDTRTLRKKYKGHSDFVKTIITARLDCKDVLISGGADSKIMVWDTGTGERLYTLRDSRGTMLALQDLAIDPHNTTLSEIALVSASSDPVIRRWRIDMSGGRQILDEAPPSNLPLNKNPKDHMCVHDTSVYRVLFSTYDDDFDLWTSSADGTAKCLSPAKSWSIEEVYEHGDYVRDIVVTEDWAITTGRDENIKVWDRATGKLFHIYEGHYDEVTGLALMKGGKMVTSVSIDGTVRNWGISREDLKKAIQETEERLRGESKETTPPSKSLMTAEEEAELSDLLNSDDD